jgi:hypothetical protein
MTDFEVAPLADGSGLTFTMTFALRDLSLTYTLVALYPPSS